MKPPSSGGSLSLVQRAGLGHRGAHQFNAGQLHNRATSVRARGWQALERGPKFDPQRRNGTRVETALGQVQLSNRVRLRKDRVNGIPDKAICQRLVKRVICRAENCCTLHLRVPYPGARYCQARGRTSKGPTQFLHQLPGPTARSGPGIHIRAPLRQSGVNPQTRGAARRNMRS